MRFFLGLLTLVGLLLVAQALWVTLNRRARKRRESAQSEVDAEFGVEGRMPDSLLQALSEHPESPPRRGDLHPPNFRADFRGASSRTRRGATARH